MEYGEHLSLTPEQRDFIKQQIASGRFGSESEVIGEGLRMLKEMGEFITAHKDEIRHKIEEGLAEADRGELIDGDEVFAELDRMDAADDAAARARKRPA